MKKKISLLMICIMMLASTFGSFASVTFSDVPSDHWAKGFIGKMADKKIVSGYFDDKTLKVTFKPENPVTYVEAIQFIYSTWKAANKLKSTTGLINKHKTTLVANGIPDWAHEAMAYALEYGIVHPDELRTFMSNGVQNKGKRVDVSVFIGKALDMKDAMDPLPILSFVDAEMVKSVAVPYIDLLVKKGIISGDTNNKFNPNNIITRAQMATICSKTYDLLIKDTSDQETKKEEVSDKNKKRIVDYVSKSPKMIVVKDDNDKTEVYRIESNTYVRKNGVFGDSEDIDEGDMVELIFDDEENLIRIEIDSSSVNVEGTIEKIKLYDDYYLITVEDNDDGKDKEFKVYDNTEIEFKNDEISVKDLKVGDSIKIEAKNDRAIEIKISSKTVTYDGILESDVIFKESPIIKLKVNNSEILELEVDEDVDVRENGKRRDLDDLSVGDILTATVRYNKVIKIEFTSIDRKKDYEGRIKSITIGSPSKITIVRDDDIEITYDVSKKADIEIDDENVDVYDLRPNYKVEYRVENSTITRIEAQKIDEKESFTGEIEKIYSNFNIISMKYLDKETLQYETLSVYVNDDTKIISTSGSTISLRYLDEDQEVFVDGYYEDDLFLANRIIELEE